MSTTIQSLTVATEDKKVVDLQSLIEQLAAAGATIEAEEAVPDRFFGSSSASQFCLNGRTIGVFSFESLDEQLRSSATIDKADPSHVGNTIVEWIAPPTFWGSGQIIVSYIGLDASVRDLISDVIGPPVATGVRSRAGAEPPCPPGT